MALRIWLPLNGNFDNLGASDGTVTTTATKAWNNNGKIGKCVLSNVKASYTFSELENITNFSIAYWIYIDSSIAIQNWGDIWGINCVAGSSSATIRDEFRSAVGTHQLLMGKDSTVGSDTNTYIGTGMSSGNAKDKWVHIALVKDDTTAKVYTNGVLTNTINSSTFESTPQKLTGYLIIGNTTSSAAKLNDFRIYDHCLSALEVKEISQGLILHYKLNGFSGGAGENILTNSTGNLGNTVDWKGLVTRAEENGNPYLIAKRTDTTTTSRTFCMHTVITSLVSSWAPGDKFTISGYYKVPSNETYAVGGNMFIRWTYTSGGSFSDTGFTTPTSLTKDTWIYFANTYTVPSNYVDGPVNFYLSAFSKGLSTIYWKNIKLEMGETATAWSPTLAEMGIDTAKIIDSSGYGNDGTIVGTVITETNESNGRYSISSKFSDNADSITIPPCFSVGQTQTEMTTSVWAKTDTLNDTTPNLISLGENNFWRFRLASASSVWWYIRIGDTQCNATYSISGKNLLDNNWHHYAVTFKDGIVIFYIDGVQVGTTDKSSVATYVTCNSADNTWHLAGYRTTSEKFIGNLADARIYTTALSAEDILTLYHTPASIDNLGGAHGFEFVEDINGKELLSIPWTSSYTTHNKTSLWNTFNENGEWTFNTYSSASSDYIKINPSGKTYYWDAIVSIAAGNQFYIGFERYDAAKTSRPNNATTYIINKKPTTDIVYERFFGTVDLSTDNVNPTDTITLRVLNKWGNSTSNTTGLATVHYLSLREVEGTPQTGSVKKNGQFITDEFIERNGIGSLYKNGIGGFTNIIEK